MSYRGMMDGWNGDENECHHLCHCTACMYDEDYNREDEAYESWRDEEMD